MKMTLMLGPLTILMPATIMKQRNQNPQENQSRPS